MSSAASRGPLYLYRPSGPVRVRDAEPGAAGKPPRPGLPREEGCGDGIPRAGPDPSGGSGRAPPGLSGFAPAGERVLHVEVRAGPGAGGLVRPRSADRVRESQARRQGGGRYRIGQGPVGVQRGSFRFVTGRLTAVTVVASVQNRTRSVTFSSRCVTADILPGRRTAGTGPVPRAGGRSSSRGVRTRSPRTGKWSDVPRARSHPVPQPTDDVPRSRGANRTWAPAQTVPLSSRSRPASCAEASCGAHSRTGQPRIRASRAACARPGSVSR